MMYFRSLLRSFLLLPACLACAQGSGKISTVRVVQASEVRLGSLRDARDGRRYATVAIGTQTWLSEDLAYPLDGSRCYDDLAKNCRLRGRLYDWSSAQRACPEGWRLPSDSDWSVLEAAAGGRDRAGKALRTTDGWSLEGNADFSGDDLYGFRGSVTGYFQAARREFLFGSTGAYFWSATEAPQDSAHVRVLGFRNSIFMQGKRDQKDGLAVRCLKN